MKEFFSKERMLHSLKFVLIFLISFFLISFVLDFFLFQIEFFYALIESVFVNLLGFSNEIIFQNHYIVSSNKMDFQISSLCTGNLELSILISAIIASIGISLKRRIVGSILVILLIVIFNSLRLFVVTFFLLNFDSGVADFAHQIIFRIFLFVTIVGYYFVWLNYGKYFENPTKLVKLVKKGFRKI